MRWRSFSAGLLLFAFAGLVPAQAAPPLRIAPGGAAAGQPPAGVPDLFSIFNRAELVLEGRVTGVQYGPVGLSDPPLHSVQLTFGDVRRLRGTLPAPASFRYVVRQEQQPEFNPQTRFLVALVRPQPDAPPVVQSIEASAPERVRLVEEAVSLPFGWKKAGGKLLSPWAALGENAWKLPAGDGPRCGTSGRPALLAGASVTLGVKQVPPKQFDPNVNPFGDGQFEITVTNVGPAVVEVPALLTADGRTVDWPNSLFVLVEGQPYLLPAAGSPAAMKPLTLGPGEKVSTVIDTLPIAGVPWPRGGSRISFQFCLGEIATTNFFYYLSRRHDRMRDDALRRAKGRQ